MTWLDWRYSVASRDKKVGTLAMRISANEHKRLKELAITLGIGEAATIRMIVNEWCSSRGRSTVFTSKRDD